MRGSKVANSFSLQLNSEFFSGSPACSRSSDPSDCPAWQQFVYAYDGWTAALTVSSCRPADRLQRQLSLPAGTPTPPTATPTSAAEVTSVTAKHFASVSFYGSAATGGND